MWRRSNVILSGIAGIVGGIWFDRTILNHSPRPSVVVDSVKELWISQAKV